MCASTRACKIGQICLLLPLGCVCMCAVYACVLCMHVCCVCMCAVYACVLFVYGLH